MKLFAERLSQSLGSKHRVPVYIFRLGQVHGELQSCTDSLKQGLSRNTGVIHVPDQPSNAIFVFSIAEAIRAILFESTTPNIYTVIAHPALSFADLVEWYACELGLSATVVAEKVKPTYPITQGFSAVRSWVKQGLSGIMDHYKELLSAIVSKYSEELDQKLRFARTKKIAGSTIHAYFDSLIYRPFEALNDIPGTRFTFSSGARTPMKKAEQDVQELIRHLT
jgi:hypothetical protein